MYEALRSATPLSKHSFIAHKLSLLAVLVLVLLALLVQKSANTDAACALAALFDAHKLAAGYSAERKLRLLDAPEHAHALKKAATAAAPPTHATKRD